MMSMYFRLWWACSFGKVEIIWHWNMNLYNKDTTWETKYNYIVQVWACCCYFVDSCNVIPGIVQSNRQKQSAWSLIFECMYGNQTLINVVFVCFQGQFDFCHQCIMEYLRTFDIYSNFSWVTDNWNNSVNTNSDSSNTRF